MNIKHIGVNFHRRKTLPEEDEFAKAWEEQNDVTQTLAWLLNTFDPVTGQQQKGVISQRDADVAATVIQWLGSPVGQCFLRNVQDRINENL